MIKDRDKEAKQYQKCEIIRKSIPFPITYVLKTMTHLILFRNSPTYDYYYE